ncbi:MAG: 3-phosphoserine/phosphohydroxythreonine transaminase [Taibaiella sp.]|nr:3-phosphoserine/phosphohydroxythreonine transaminase [Taibaiella sp.]
MKRKINFNAGPAILPEEVLKHAAEAVIEYNNSGLSILEISHRGKAFDNIIQESCELISELCGLNNDHTVLWMHGGGRLQFSMIPMNFLAQNGSAGYIDSGHWAEEALEYATYYGDVQILASSKEHTYNRLPQWPEHISKDLAYLHYTTNNTIYGTQYKNVPDCKVPLIADMSSDIFSCKRDYASYAMFYAAAQKNIGPAGCAVAVIRKDMLQRVVRDLPPMLRYQAHAEQGSVLNTPPVFAIYASLLMLRWTKAKGIAAIEKENNQKAELLYSEVERNSLFHANVKRKEDRSTMNVCFTAKNKDDESAFLNFCEMQNIIGIKGHRSAGGFRVSIYNAMPLKDVQKLVSVMQEYEKD